jgi:hypothetical protein
MTGYQGERQRSLKQVSDKPKITFMQGFKLWANQWRWSNIKAIWKQDYKRVYYSSTNRLDSISRKLGR